MKNLKALGLFILAALASLAAAVYAANWVARRGSIDADKVVVAAADIPLGSKIVPTMLNTVDWPRGSIPEGAFHDLQQLQAQMEQVAQGMEDDLQRVQESDAALRRWLREQARLAREHARVLDEFDPSSNWD